MYSELGADGSYLNSVFKDKDKAEKYIKVQEQLEPNYHFYMCEQELKDDKFDENSRVMEYYSYVIPFDCTLDEVEQFNDPEREPKIYTEDNYVEYHDYSIQAWSVKGFNYAKEIAEHAYKLLTEESLSCPINYVIIDKRNHEQYLPYDTKICPVCGGKIKHPYTGEITDEQIEEDMKTCQLVEVIDENDFTLGYHAICRNK